MPRFTILSVAVISLAFGQVIYAGLDSFGKDLQYADSTKAGLSKAVDKFSPQKEFGNDYTSNPEQTKYFHGVTQGNDEGLDVDAANAAPNDQAGKDIDDAFNTRPVFHVNYASKAMQKGDLIENDAHDISRGISDKYVDCKKAKRCYTKHIKKVCNEQTRSLTKACLKTAVVKVIKQPYQESKTDTGSLKSKDVHTATIPISLTGIVTSFHVQLHSDNVWKCKTKYSGYLNQVFLSVDNVSCGDKLGDLGFSNDKLHIQVQAGDLLTFSMRGSQFNGKWSSSSYQLTVLTTKYKKVAKVSWEESCHDTN